MRYTTLTIVGPGEAGPVGLLFPLECVLFFLSSPKDTGYVTVPDAGRRTLGTFKGESEALSQGPRTLGTGGGSRFPPLQVPIL